MTDKKNDSNILVNLLFCLFVILFVLSYTNITNNTLIRYAAIILLNVFGLFYWIFYKKNNKMEKKIVFLFILLMLNMIISVLFSNYIGESFVKTLSVFDSFLLFFVLIPNIINKKTIKNIIKIIYYGLFIVLLYEFIRYRGVYTYDGGTRLSVIHNRLILNFIYPSSLGWPGFLLCISSVYLFDDKNERLFKKIIYAISFIFGLYLLYKCDIRTAIYSLLIFMVIYIYNNKLKQSRIFTSNKKFFKFIIFLFIFAVVVFAGLYLFNENVTIDKINLILSNRITYYKQALNDILSGNVMYGIGAYRNLNGSLYGIAQIDNSYLNFIYSYGLINLLILMYIIIIIYKRIKLKENSKTDDKDVNKNKWFILALYISFLIYSFFEITLLNISSLLAIIVWPIIISYILVDTKNTKI